MAIWKARQFGSVVDDFKPSCPPGAWDDLLIRYALLMQFGTGAGPAVAKKLKNGDGIWELLGHADNCQPRLLFYVSDGNLIVFVHAFIKQSKSDYKRAVQLAQKRRSAIQRRLKATYEIAAFVSPIRH